MIHLKLAIWSLVPLHLRKPACSSGSSLFISGSILLCMILIRTLLMCGISAIVLFLTHTLGSPFLGIGMKTDLFQSFGHFMVFQILWHIAVMVLMAPSPPDLNSYIGMSSVPGAFLSATAFSACRTSLSSTFGSISKSFGTNSSFMSGSFLYRFEVYSRHLFLTSSFSVKSLPLSPLTTPTLGTYLPVISLIFLNSSLVFPFLLTVLFDLLTFLVEISFFVFSCFPLEFSIQPSHFL